MQKERAYKTIGILLIIVMIFGWGSMLAKILLFDYYEFLRYNPASYGFLILLFAMPAFMIIWIIFPSSWKKAFLVAFNLWQNSYPVHNIYFIGRNVVPDQIAA
ncbi:MAG: hypothetical protein AAB116_02405, partial [Candidatus Poribacteria bacterium]